MRISESIKQSGSLNNMRQNASEAERLSQNISTGKRVINPSDDPISYVKGEEKLRTITLNKSTQNIVYTQRGELDTIDYTLEEIGSLIQEAKVLTLQAANGSFDEASYSASATQIDKMMDRLIELANTKIGKVFLFSGTKSFNAPVALNKSGKLADMFHPGQLWSTTLPVQSLRQDETVLNGDGNAKILFIDDQKKEHQLNIELSYVKNPTDLVDQMNETFQNYNDHQSFGGNHLPKNFLVAQIGADGKIYIDSAKDFKIRSVETNIFRDFGTKFEETTEKDWVRYSNNYPDKQSNFSLLYGEKLIGTIPEEFTIKVVSSGKLDDAEYVILNAARETISEPVKLTGIIRAHNSNNEKADDWTLSFNDEFVNPFFREGLEFRFYPDTFAVYQGNNEIRDIPLDGGKKLPVTITANSMFFELNGKSPNTFDLFKNVRDAMESNQQELVASYIDDFDFALNQVLKYRANAGSTNIEVDHAENRIKESDLNNQEQYSELIDQDFPEAATELKKNQLKSDATYQVTSKLIQPGLINFLN